MNHYIYIINFTDGMQYVGCRSTHLAPELDTCYLGSGKALPERTLSTCTKHILKSFDTRAEAIKAEARYILDNNCVESPGWYNLAYSANDRHGKTADICKGTKATQEKLTGRRAEDFEYIRIANKKRKQYVGSNRTPAQLASDEVRKVKSRGKNPDKGHKGITNSAFIPWYFTDINSNTTIVFGETKRSYAHKLGLTPRQMTHRFHHSNINKPVKQGILKGWIFGNLEDLETD